MKTSSPLVAAAALALLLVVAAVQGIRLDAESHAALSNQMLNKSREGVVVTSSSDGEPSGEVGKTVSEEKDRAGHRMPDIHVDYYGPRGHIPRHN